MSVAWALTALILGSAGDVPVRRATTGAPNALPHQAPASAAQTLTGLADQLTAQIRAAVPPPPLAVSLQPAEARVAPDAQALLPLLLARLSAARLAPAPLTCDHDCDQAALGSGARTLLQLTLREDAGSWTVQGELHGVWRNFWDGARSVPPPGPTAALSVTLPAPKGAESLPPPETGTPTLVATELATLPDAVEALGAADVDGDGTDELLVLTSRALLTYDAGGQLLGQHPLDALAPAPVASRDPRGMIAVLPSPLRVLAFSQTRAAGEVLAWDAGARSWRATGTLDSPRWGCSGQTAQVHFTEGENTFAPAALKRPFGRISREAVALTCRLSADGAYVAQVFPDGAAQVQMPGGPRTLTAVGSGVAFVDLGGQGTPELATSSALLAPDPDVLTFSSAKAPSRTISLPGRILELTALRMAPGQREALVAARALPDGTWALTRVEEISR